MDYFNQTMYAECGNQQVMGLRGLRRSSRGMGGVVSDASLAISKLTTAIKKLTSFITNDNGVIAARDKIANYVTQVNGGNRDAAYKTLYSGFSLAHSDIKDVATSAYYEGVYSRLNEAAINYIVNHARDSNVIFGEDVDPKVTLDRYVQFVTEGKNLDHAFWLAFTGRKDPYDIKTGNALPPKTTTTTAVNPITAVAENYSVLKDAAGTILQIKDAAGNLLNPSTPQYQAAAAGAPHPTEAGMNVVTVIVIAAVLGGIVLASSGDKKKPAK